MKNSIGILMVKVGQVAVVALVLSLVSCGSTPEGNHSDGKRWFGMQHCGTCHGNGGSGGRAPGIQQTELSYREFLSKIRKSNSVSMPSFSKKQLPDQNVADILSYLQKTK